MRSQVASPAAQLPKIESHPLKPGASGSLSKKSRYCWRTKKLGLSIGFAVLAVLSRIVMVAEDVEASGAPCAFESEIVKVSLPSEV